MTTYNTIESYEYNEDLVGFVVKFKSGSITYTQFNKETNKLHADYGLYSLERYTEYDDELTEEEEDELRCFIKNNADVQTKDNELNNA